MSTQMIIASRLVDGRVVFMGAGAAWVGSIDAGVPVETQEDGERLMKVAERAVDENLVVDPYLIDVRRENGSWRPVHVREAIRAFGPSVRTDADFVRTDTDLAA